MKCYILHYTYTTHKHKQIYSSCSQYMAFQNAVKISKLCTGFCWLTFSLFFDGLIFKHKLCKNYLILSQIIPQTLVRMTHIFRNKLENVGVILYIYIYIYIIYQHLLMDCLG